MTARVVNLHTPPSLPEAKPMQPLKVTSKGATSKSTTSKSVKCTIQPKLYASQLAFKEHVVTPSVLPSHWFTPAKASGSFICSSRTPAGRKNVSWREREARRFAKKRVNETICKIKVCKTCILVMAAYCLYIYAGRMEKDSLEIRDA